ncbi:universal stress protein [Sorangium sp. So ce1099]|uniref:universal stress protein n=1 Tax=Sorangium sp. So ce1099 TaxID=3133331 RepID=UPI003F5E5068
MPIVCDTDFSPAAQRAGRAAASLAQRLGEELHLVHVVDEFGAEFLCGHEDDPLLEPEREMLGRQTDALRQLGARVEERLVAGLRHVWLAEIASACQARLMVISHRPGNRLERLFGEGVEKILRSSPVPVLVAEDSERLVDWLQGERSLRVLVGLDSSGSSRAALDWLTELDSAGPLEALVATFHRERGLASSWTRFVSAAATRGIEHPYRDRPVAGARSPGEPRALEGATSHVEVITRRPAAELLRLAQREQVDLLVLARDPSQGRLWRAPSWRSILQPSLPCSAVCVPATYAPAGVSSSRSASAAQRVRRRRPRARWFARSARGARRAHGGMNGRA